jgi:hypothetical protein
MVYLCRHRPDLEPQPVLAAFLIKCVKVPASVFDLALTLTIDEVVL